MAEGPDVEAGASKGLGFLKHKVGPLPIGVWLLAFAAIYWYMIHKRGTGGGQATDPAGNVGTIDPATGYVYGTAQDQQALNSGSGGSGSSSNDTGGSSGSTTAGAYADNNAWGRAAVNYLVGLGVDPTRANEAIQQYLSSQVLTADQQGDVNLAIQGLGPPPQLPGPVGTAPPPIVTPGGGTVYATNPPSGLVVSGKTDTTVDLKWNSASNASGYTVRYGTTPAASDNSQTVGSSVTSTTVGSLKPGTLYYFTVQATPARPTDGFASTSTTTSTPQSTPPPSSGGGGGGGGSTGGSRTYPVRSGDTLFSIAQHYYGNGNRWPDIYHANQGMLDAQARQHGHTTGEPGYGPGSKWIFPGEVLTIP
ncbi:MAG TPA: fibronectin type III domain-containing protein [Streptosporangiaceae bacterium]|nr:fibronectin type III domain-containing protein [Streptosporangiaceae bacterium]